MGFGHQTGCNLSFNVTLKAAHYFGFPSYLVFGAGQTVSPKWPPLKRPSQELQGVRRSLASLFCLSLSVVRVVSTLGLKWDFDSGPQRDRSRPAGLLVLVMKTSPSNWTVSIFFRIYHSGEHHRTSNVKL